MYFSRRKCATISSAYLDFKTIHDHYEIYTLQIVGSTWRTDQRPKRRNSISCGNVDVRCRNQKRQNSSVSRWNARSGLERLCPLASKLVHLLYQKISPTSDTPLFGLQIIRMFHALGITDIRAVRALREREKGGGPLGRFAFVVYCLVYFKVHFVGYCHLSKCTYYVESMRCICANIKDNFVVCFGSALYPFLSTNTKFSYPHETTPFW